jgi:hypothetical protein
MLVDILKQRKGSLDGEDLFELSDCLTGYGHRACQRAPNSPERNANISSPSARLLDSYRGFAGLSLKLFKALEKFRNVVILKGYDPLLCIALCFGRHPYEKLLPVLLKRFFCFARWHGVLPI